MLDVDFLSKRSMKCEKASNKLIEAKLSLPAYENKYESVRMHLNLLDARHAISVTERTAVTLACGAPYQRLVLKCLCHT